tara:strand:+ start:214 stop:837 length:624 start_codon:yes stop_codon:yes gene_type:complete
MNKYNLNYKLFFIIKIFLVYLVIYTNSYAENLKPSSKMVVLGSDKAPVKIKVFSSLTCPHCANFHIKVIPKIKDKYVDSGKVQLIFIDFPLDQAGFNASKLLHCVDEKKQIIFLDMIYEKQDKWTNGSSLDEINNNLKKIVKNLGINSAKFEECLNDDVIADKILNNRIDGQKKYSIKSTPTIIINEKKFDGSAIFKNIEKKIKKLI